MRRAILCGIVGMVVVCVSGCSVQVEVLGTHRAVRVRPGPDEERPTPVLEVATVTPWWTNLAEWILSLGDAFALKEEAKESGKNVRKALDTNGHLDSGFWAGLFRLKVEE